MNKKTFNKVMSELYKIRALGDFGVHSLIFPYSLFVDTAWDEVGPSGKIQRVNWEIELVYDESIPEWNIDPKEFYLKVLAPILDELKVVYYPLNNYNFKIIEIV